MIRVARIMQWTYEEMLVQPLAYVYELAADAQLENESLGAKPPPDASNASTGGGRERIIRFTLREAS